MEKLFVVSTVRNEYSFEIQDLLQANSTKIKSCSEDDLTTDYLIENKIDVIISDKINHRWYNRFNQLGIVSCTIGPLAEISSQADIVVDFRAAENNKYFAGPKYSVKNSEFNLIEVVNLITPLEFDSCFFGFKIAYVTSRHLTKNIVGKIDQFIDKNSVKLVEYLCNCHDDKSVRIAEDNNYHFADIRLSLSLGIEVKNNQVNHKDIRFGLASHCDIVGLRSIGDGIYKDSRYYFDGNFDLAKITEFYQDWIEKGVLGTFDDCCFAIYQDDRPIGFCTLRFHSNKTAKIGLFGIASEHSGKGYGRFLLNCVINELHQSGVRRISVVTQGRNYYAQRLYQSLGFRTDSNELWYHKWVKI